MKRVHALLFFAVVLAVAFSGSALASSAGKVKGSDSIAFLHDSATTHQSAVFAAFLAWLPDAGGDALNDVDTAISVSNVLAAPQGTLRTNLFGPDVAGNRTGTVTFYLWDRDGTMVQYETQPGSPGSGLNPDGTLGPGQTYTVRLAEILAAATGMAERDISFTGYGWVVANFDAVQGTYNVTIFNVGFTQNFELLPGMGQGGWFGGIPVNTVIP